MQKKFDTIIKSLFPKGGNVLLAVSGGVDSMVMADLFAGCGIVSIAVAHCNFHLRGKDSDEDASFVEKWCADHGVKFFKKDFDTSSYGKSEGVSIEMAARDLRYAWFNDLCTERAFDALAVAHNLNDNAETMMLNLLRGTGIRGACGMKMSSILPIANSKVTLVRPLLDFSRQDIQEYAEEKGLEWREDKTNAESEYKRNKLRNKVFPLFAEVNPSFLYAFGRDMKNFAQVAELADDYFDSVKPSVVSSADGDTIISIDKLKGLKHRDFVLYRLLEPYGFNSSDVSDIATLLTSSTVSGKTFTSASHMMISASDKLIVRSLNPSGTTGSIDIIGPGQYKLAGRNFVVEKRELRPGEALKQPAGVIMADASRLTFPFVVRGWRSGDWMLPFGLGGRKKLSDLFVDLKYSLPEKSKALVAVLPWMAPYNRVAALLGVRIDDSIKVTEATTEVVVVRFV